ncbi:DUF6225 family protein [Streptomyces sp. NPDC006692]|uniref:DUF6225 family protein n=1 Tax=Streptomyces sp. NPDC006692 TaxID=3364758 RepID=UPI0036768F41
MLNADSWDTRRGGHASSLPRMTDMFDHAPQVWTAGCLRRALGGLPDGTPLHIGVAETASNAHDLWIGPGLDAEGVPSRVIDFWSSSRPTLHRRSGRYARAGDSPR